jgi:hypothetical protein
MEGERLLVVMVLRQVVRDLQRGGPEVRAEALHFLDDLSAVALWCDILDIDTRRFRHLVLERRGRGTSCA